MWSYILKRIFQFIPSLFVLSLVVFGLSRLSPGDPLQNLLEEYQSSGKVLSLSQESELIQNLKSELGLDTPDFYFSLRRRSNVLNYVRINNPNILQNLNELAYQFGNGETTAQLYEALINSNATTGILRINWKYWSTDSFENKEQIQLWKKLNSSKNALNNYLPSFIALRRTGILHFTLLHSFTLTLCALLLRILNTHMIHTHEFFLK